MINKKQMKPLLYITAVIISAILGVVFSHSLLSKSISEPENLLWKYSIIVFVLSMIFIYWINEEGIDDNKILESYYRIFLDMVKFLFISLFLLLPYFTVMIYRNAVSFRNVTNIFPGFIFIIASLYIWTYLTNIFPEIRNDTTKILLKGLLIIVIFTVALPFFGLSLSITIFIGSVAYFIYFLHLLKQVREKILESRKND
jgi:hypothetical protein